MIVYTVVGQGQYVDLEDGLKMKPEGQWSMYVNLTNRCTCSCTFCLRSMKKMAENETLWLKREPTVDEVKKALDGAPWDHINEVVFCGFGEPTERIDILLQVARYFKETYHKPIRINTNGLGNLVNSRDIAPDFKGLIDTVSISLNTPNADRYHELVRSRFGDQSFQAMLDFAKECTRYVPHVVMTTVDTTLSKEEEAQCQAICDQLGVTYRIRPWES